MNVSESTIRSVIKRWGDSNAFKSAPRNGRPQKLGDREARRLTRIVKNNRKAPLSVISQEFGADVHKETIGIKLRYLGLRSRKAIRKPFISKKNAKIRLWWSKARIGWTLKDWKRVIWSDECRIELWQGSRDRLVRRTTSESNHPDCISPTVKHGGGSLMVWACFCWDKIGPIVVIDGNLNHEKYISILTNKLLPFWKQMKRRFRSPIFQDDGARAHTAHAVVNWKRMNVINSFIWPAQSPDLNPIEHVWSFLKQRVKRRKPHPNNLKQLEEYIYEEWKQLDPSMLRNVVFSMPRRIRGVVRSKGYQTSY